MAEGELVFYFVINSPFGLEHIINIPRIFGGMAGDCREMRWPRRAQGSLWGFPSANMGRGESVSGHSRARRAPRPARNPPHFPPLPGQREKLLTLRHKQRAPNGTPPAHVPSVSPQPPAAPLAKYAAACAYHQKKGLSIKTRQNGEYHKRPLGPLATPTLRRGLQPPGARPRPLPPGGSRWLCPGKVPPGQAGSLRPAWPPSGIIRAVASRCQQAIIKLGPGRAGPGRAAERGLGLARSWRGPGQNGAGSGCPRCHGAESGGCRGAPAGTGGKGGLGGSGKQAGPGGGQLWAALPPSAAQCREGAASTCSQSPSSCLLWAWSPPENHPLPLKWGGLPPRRRGDTWGWCVCACVCAFMGT